ncbi:hypothetical protein C8R46DRAFT_1208297 [Mycena filopes]|nr:hypothetical protein C8R46DRAFT_1208297 [Mycena filopes]
MPPERTTRHPPRPHPLELWRTAKQLFAEEMAFPDTPPGPAAHCGRCKTKLDLTDGRFFSCGVCSEVLCHTCCLFDHRRRPLHMLREWSGTFWETTTLQQLGLIYQLGHRGRPCASPAVHTSFMHIFDTCGVQKVEYRYCECLDGFGKPEQLLDAGWHRASPESDCCQTWALIAQLEKLGLDPTKDPMAPIPFAFLLPFLCFSQFLAPIAPTNSDIQSGHPPAQAFCIVDMAPALKFRKKRVIDVDMGVDGANRVADMTGDRGIYLSNDGLRHHEELINVSYKKRRLRPTNLEDRLAEWLPVDDSDVVPDATLLDQMDKVSGTGKRKRYESSDDPMAQWRKEKQLFLDETLRREGLGDSAVAPECALCEKALRPLGGEPARMFRCTTCGEFLQCLACCLSHHRLSPLHCLEEWTGEFWKKTTLNKIGLVYHIGHGGRPCATPAVGQRTMVVIDTTGIHVVTFRYCGCARSRQSSNVQLLLRNGWYPASLTDPSTCATFVVLDLFRLLNVVGNVNAHDFVLTLERQTDALGYTGIRWMPDRYRAFSRISRQWGFIQRARRAGRAHDAAKLEATKLGEMMVICWACPHDGRNLPPDWRDIDLKYRFLYMLILALDANFKLKNRIRANERYDPSLGPGWGAFVEPTGYKEHLKNYVGENDISTCIVFAALLQKDTRLTTGLRTSGVGGCVCARHKCVRPNGLGDLQKGERYANMDYIVMSCLVGFALMLLTISYDIACQWKKNLRDRNDKLPTRIQLDLDNVEVQCGLPVWHASSHELECSNENSLSFLVGVGKSDGEGVERTWADLNPSAFHTKEMSVGNRADTLEDKIDAHNFLKNLGQGDALRRKLLIALAERTRQVDAFKEVNKTVPTELRNAWQNQIDVFVRDHSQPNPYVLPNSGAPTEAQLCLALKQEEEEEIRQGRARLHATSATAFLSAGIQLEDAQRRIHAELAGRALVTADRASKIHDKRVALLVKLGKFRKLQAVFTPGALRSLEVERAGRDSEAVEVKAESIKLYMPSDLSAVEREVGCVAGVVAIERRLRENQCHNALVQLRAHLHTKRHLIGFRNTQVTGQIKATKARTLIAQVGERATAAGDKYARGRAALTALEGEEYAAHFKPLKSGDITLDGEQEMTETAARKKLAMLGAGKGARTPCHVAGTSRKILSWIWSATGALEDDEKSLHESLRVEWCRAKARKRRWEEEAGWWIERVAVRLTEAAPLQAGLEAYARRQAHTYTELRDFFQAEWSRSVGEVATSMVAEPLQEGADSVALFG